MSLVYQLPKATGPVRNRAEEAEEVEPEHPTCVDPDCPASLRLRFGAMERKAVVGVEFAAVAPCASAVLQKPLGLCPWYPWAQP